MTLDEWKAQQSKDKKEAPKFNVRKAGEGADIDPKWKKATSYRKENVEESEDEEEEEVGLTFSNFKLLIFMNYCIDCLSSTRQQTEKDH